MEYLEIDTGRRKHKTLIKDISEIMLLLLEKKSSVQPIDLVNYARPNNSPIHKYFNWNNRTAGEQWRKQQARVYICWAEVRIKNKGKCRAFASIKEKSGRKGYVLINTALSEPDYKKQLLLRALREVEYWSEQYRTLNALKPIFQAINKVKRKVQK